MAKQKRRYKRSTAKLSQAGILAASAQRVMDEIKGSKRKDFSSSWSSNYSKSRKTASKTKTALRKKQKISQEISQHNDLSRKWVGAYSLGKRSFPKTLGKYMYYNMNEWVLEGTQGRQIIDWPEAIMTRYWLVGDTSDVRSERVRLPDDIYQLNPYSTAPTNALYSGPQPAVSDQALLNVQKIRTNLDLLSMTDVAQIVDVYWLTPKFDTNLDPNTMWNNIADSLSLGQAAATNATNLTNLTAGAGLARKDNWGANPFSNRAFGKSWRLLRKVSVVLQPGDQRNYTVHFNYNKVLKRDTFSTNRVSHYLKDLTIFPLIVARAGMVGIKAAEDADATEVGYGVPKVGVIHNQHITFGAMQANSFTTSRVYKGIIENDTTDVKQIIDDVDEVNIQTLA